MKITKEQKLLEAEKVVRNLSTSDLVVKYMATKKYYLSQESLSERDERVMVYMLAFVKRILKGGTWGNDKSAAA
jgi:hypothetical protein